MALTKIDDRGLNTPIDLLDNEKIRFGTGNDLQIYTSGNNSVITHSGDGDLHVEVTGSGEDLYLNANDDVYIRTTTNENAIKCIGDGAVELYYDNSKKIETFASGIQVTGRIEIPDGSAYGVRIGTGDDLQLYHDGNHSTIVNTTGELIIRDDSRVRIRTDELVINSGDNSESIIYAAKDGAVELYYDNVRKLRTTAEGAQVDGSFYIADNSHLILNDTNKAKFGNGGDLEIYHDGSNSHIVNTTADLNLQSNSLYLKNQDGDHVYVKCVDDAQVELYYDGNKKLETNADGIAVEGHVWLGDGEHVKLGSATNGDLQLYHSGGQNFIKVNGDGRINLLASEVRAESADGSETMAKFIADGACELRYNDITTFKTTTQGIRVERGQSGAATALDIFGYEGCDAEVYMAADNGDDNGDQWKMVANAGGSDWRLYSYHSGSWTECISAHGNAHVLLSYGAGSGKVETTSSGCKVYGSVNETSDIALKKDVSRITNALANIKQLNGYSYTFKDTNHKSLGLITQDVEKVYPDLVEGEEGTKTLQYSGIIAPLVEAIKELSTEIETLKTKVVALEAA